MQEQQHQDLRENLNPSTDQEQILDQEQHTGFFAQAWLLTYKNFVLTIKHPKNIIFLFLTPFILSAFMAGFQLLARDNANKVLADPGSTDLPGFPRCIGQDCFSVSFLRIDSAKSTTSDKPWITYTQKYIKDKAQIPQNEIYRHNQSIKTLQDLEKYYDYLNTRPNKTQIGIIFCSDKPDVFELQLFCPSSDQFRYYMMLNKTDSLSVIFHDIMEPLPTDPRATSLKVMIDNAILNFLLNQTIQQSQQKIKYSTSQFPVGPNRYIDNYDIITDIGAFYYMITPLFAFLFIQSQIVRQKEYKLRQGLNIFGAGHGAYWISWFVIANLYALIVSVASFLAGLAFQFGFFLETPFYVVIFFMMYPFTLAMQMMAFFLSTLSPTVKAANAVSYGIVLFAIVVQSFVANNNLLVFLFSDDASALITFLKYFLCFYPPFSYTKIFTNITLFSGYHFNLGTRKWQQGMNNPGSYNTTTWTQEIHSLLPFGGENATYTRYSDMISMLVLIGDMIFFVMLAWYFDHVIESNRGRGDSIIFPIKNIMKRFIKKNRDSAEPGMDAIANHNFLFQDQEESTIKERNRVYKNAQADLPALGIRIKGLSKTFSTMCSRERVQAIRNFNLQIDPNELMGILGHNGAGKTTLINILTGVLSPDQTQQLEIIINDNPIDKIDEIRKYIGVCSQFDILWNELTAQQHLYMFARLKNIPRENIPKKIDEMLNFVNLSNQKKARVNSFSGGMKRRLSLAIAAIGNPKIILLDQPTTGLDPKVRQQVWELIEKLKKNKSIILTTHSMQQADILADRLCVMVKGRLKCIGTSFYLKHKYGQGHRITLNIEDNKSKQVLRIIKKLFPKAVQVDSKGGNLIVGLSDFDSLLQMVKKLENKDADGLDQYTLKQAIKDWNVSHSTLEQVFMKVSKQKEQ